MKKIKNIIREELLKEAIALADEQSKATNDSYLVVKDKKMAKSGTWDAFGPYVVGSFDDFMARTKMLLADVRLLIKAGTFDELEAQRTRPELMWRLEWWVEKQKRQKEKKVLSLFESKVMNPKLLPRPSNYDTQTILKQEVETLGFLLSRHPLTLYGDRLRKLNYVQGKYLVKYVGRKVTTVGWLITAKITETKNGDMMEFMSFEDTTAIYETTFFPDAYASFIHMISKDYPFILQGKVESHYNAVTLTVENVGRL